MIDYKVFIILIYILITVYFVYHFSNKNIYENFTDSELQTYDIALSRYNEDIEWINNYPFKHFNIKCYNKGPQEPNDKCRSDKCKIINIENVGRCDHTYLYHIINNYDNLAPITLFIPASCMKHQFKYNIVMKLLELINETKTTVLLGTLMNDIRTDLYQFTLNEWSSSDNTNKTANAESKLDPCSIRPFGAWYEANFGDLHTQVICHFGIFAVAKQHIIQHPKSYYENLISYLDHHSNPEAGHYFERSWAAIFYPYPESCVHFFNHG